MDEEEEEENDEHDNEQEEDAPNKSSPVVDEVSDLFAHVRL